VGWVVLGVWLGVIVLAAVVLGFCLYEVSWKGSRLSRDLARLSEQSTRLDALQQELTEARRRLADARLSGAGG
jgi:Tfp pilus assembly protein PilN